MSTEIIKLTNPKDKLIVSQEFTSQYNNALAVCDKIKAEFEEEARLIDNLIVTEENIQIVKKQREAHNKAFDELDTQRKTIKKAYNTPVKNFEDKFKQTVKAAHETTKGKYDKLIAEYDNKLITEKTESVKANKPLIVTTNLTFEELKNPSDND